MNLNLNRGLDETPGSVPYCVVFGIDRFFRCDTRYCTLCPSIDKGTLEVTPGNMLYIVFLNIDRDWDEKSGETSFGRSSTIGYARNPIVLDVRVKIGKVKVIEQASANVIELCKVSR